MSVLAQDFEKGLDLTTQPSWSGADANQLVDAGIPAADKGMVITTTDSGSTPDVPDASADSASPVKKLRWQRYFWRRVRNSGLSPLLYIWNPNATSDATYLKWQVVSSGSNSGGALTFANYAALRAYDFTSLVTGQVTVFVLGYATAGDGGFGEFRYDSTDASSADDDGRVLVTTVGSYRFKRVVAPGEFAKPEWFGGFSGVSSLAGGRAVTKASRKCVAYYRTLEYGFGTYWIANRIVVPRNTTIKGQGKGLTTIKLVDASADLDAYPANSYFCCFMWMIAGTTSSAAVGDTYLTLADEGAGDNSSVSEMSINGNYDNQTRDGLQRYLHGIRAVNLMGGNCVIRNVEAQQCGSAYVSSGSGEAIIFRIGKFSGQTNDIGGIIDGCEYSNPGHPLLGGATLANYGWPTTIGGNWGGHEYTVIALSLDGGDLALGQCSGKIINCYVHDLPRSLTGIPNPINAISMAGGYGVEIANNRVINVDGNAYYCDNTESVTQKTDHVDLHDNIFKNVFRGIRLFSGTSTNRHSFYNIHDNIIELYQTSPSYPLAAPPAGVLIDFAGSLSFSGDYVFHDIVIQNNQISGGGNFTQESGTLSLYSRGIYILLTNGDLYNNLAFNDNIIDIPQVGANSYSQTIGPTVASGINLVGTTVKITNYTGGSDDFSAFGCKNPDGTVSAGYTGAEFVLVANPVTPTYWQNGSTLQFLYYYENEPDSLAIYFVNNTSAIVSYQNTGRKFRWSATGNRTPKGKLLYTMLTTAQFTRYAKVYQPDSTREELCDPLDLSLATGKILDLDYAYPRNVGDKWFNTALKRLWIAQDTRREINSGGIVAGRSYSVLCDDNATGVATYNGVAYGHNSNFTGLPGITVFTLSGVAHVYEASDYCWQPLTRNSYEIYAAVEPTYYNYGISLDRFLDSRFFVYFNASLNGDHRIALPDPTATDTNGNKIYKGRTCFVRYGRNAVTDAHEIILTCGTVAAGVLTLIAGKIVDPVACAPADEIVLTPASKAPLGGIVGLLCDGEYWFITSQVSDPQEILLYTQIGTSAVSPNDFELTNWTVAPYYHIISTNLKDRQMKGIVVLAFPDTASVGFYLPDPANYPGYQFKLAIRVGNNAAYTATAYCGTPGSLLAKLSNPGIVGNKGEAVTTAVVAAGVAADRIIVVEVTSIGATWLIMCN